MLEQFTLGGVLMLVVVLLHGTPAIAGGPFGIDHSVNEDNRGIWKRSNQTALLDVMIAGEVAVGLWEGGETRLGNTDWQAVDASVFSGISTTIMKHVFTRERPAETDNPNKFFQGGSHASFPSGEVAAVSAIVTPFVLEYRHDSPGVYALELLPAYDAVARVKVHGHWQSDVIAGFGVGTVAGYYAHDREQPLILGMLPHGVSVGMHKWW
jgi:membrane-associated phospholipid phosphatase